MVMTMDRRQRKTRDAIFKAFIQLLSQKNFSDITVGEIIDLADVGRATFYAHFETKDFLLKDLSAELFDHLFCEESESGYFASEGCAGCDSVFLHLFNHVQKNDNNLARLLSSKNNELFLEYFKSGVKGLVTKRIADFASRKPAIVPQDFWVNHVTATFIETLRWWLEQDMQQPPALIAEYFLQSV